MNASVQSIRGPGATLEAAAYEVPLGLFMGTSLG